MFLIVHVSRKKNIARLDAFLEAPDDEISALGGPVVGACGGAI